jgi:hypothetical protein
MYWTHHRLDPVPFVEAYQPDLQVFLVCRQLHLEASSIFYMNNTFTITRKCNRRNHIHDGRGAYLATAGVPWLAQLGSRVHLLRKIELDLDTLCPARCNDRIVQEDIIDVSEKGPISILPLLRVLWAGNLQIDVKVVHPNNAAYDKCVILRQTYHPARPPLHFDISGRALTVTIRCLQRDDLNLKKYHRTLGEIHLKRDGSGGWITFLSTANHSRKQLAIYVDDSLRFTTQEGKNLRVSKREPPTFLGLPLRLRSRILKCSLTYPKVQMINLDNERVIRDAIRPLYINRFIFMHSFSHYVTNNHFIIELTPRCIGTSSDLLRITKLLWTAQNVDTRRTDLRGSLWPNLAHWPSVQIYLNFDLAKTSTVSHIGDLLFDAIPLIQVTLGVSIDKDIPIKLHASNKSKTITLYQLRSNVSKAWEKLRPDPKDPTIDRPKIWVNGVGDVVDVVSANRMPGTIENIVRRGRNGMQNPLESPSIHSSRYDPWFVSPTIPQESAPAYEMFQYLQHLCRNPVTAASAWDCF